YLSLAKFMLDERGPQSGGKTNPRGLTYNQAQQRVVDQTEAIGHAVRATYMYSGMADVAAMTGDESYVKAVDAIWHDVVSKKLYVNLFAGSSGDIAMGERHVTLEQQTRYPWDGAVKITVTPDRARDFTIKVRIPGWARNEPIASDLYRFLDPSTDPVVLKVNG